MADMWMDVDTALAEVPVNLMPLLDDTDFKTIEAAVAYNASGMDLRWNFVTTGGALTSTAVTPTTAGAYDWTHQGDGIYTIEIPASGGASINNDTEGFGWFSGVVTGVLPFRGPVIGFRAAALNDALIDGGDTLDVNVTQFGGTNATATGGRPEVNTSHAAGTAWGSGAITAAAIAADAITAAKIADGAIDAATFAAGAINAAAIAADAITDAKVASDVTIASVTGAVGSVTATVSADVVSISGDATAANNLESYLDGTAFMPVDAHAPTFSVSGTTLTVKQPDGTTTAYTKTVTTDAGAEPITGAS